jgi:hypothetical protein
MFLVALAVPWVIVIEPLRLSVYRIVLLVLLLPCLMLWLLGKGGRIRLADIALLLFCAWCILGLTLIHGLEPSLESSGILFLETFGPYVLARCYIRDAADFSGAIRLLYWIVLFLCPFAIVETVTGQNVLRHMFEAIAPTGPASVDVRAGFTRAQSVFDHPILFGVTVGSILALVHLGLGYGQNGLRRSLRSSIVVVTAATSLSAGPIIMVAGQWFLLAWNWLFAGLRQKWYVLFCLTTIAYLSIEILASQPVLDVVVGRFVFDDGSYWFRRLIWEYGTASVESHPLWGVGKNDWLRPPWMPSSIDNFYLFLAVKHGLAAPLLMLSAFFAIVLGVSLRGGDARLAALRAGFLISMAGFFVVGWTVSFWDATYVLFFFLLGSGVWMVDAESEETPP